MNQKIKSILQAFLVTGLWSSSWVLIKFGLEGIPPVTFAGLRYFIAFLILLPLMLRRRRRLSHPGLQKRQWLILAGYGLLYFSFTQGSQFVALKYLPAINFSLLLNSTSLIVAILGIAILKEIPNPLQWLGMSGFILGVILYFLPIEIPPGLWIGYLIGGCHVLATSLSSILGRAINRAQTIDAITVTTISMGIGSITLLVFGLAFEKQASITLQNWAIIFILAAFNTAFAFTLWNHTLRTLSAIESNVINNTMTVQISILAWIFLGERFNLIQGLGLFIAIIGAILVQTRASRYEMEIGGKSLKINRL